MKVIIRFGEEFLLAFRHRHPPHSTSVRLSLYLTHGFVTSTSARDGGLLGSVTVTLDEHVATILLDRPPVNAVDRQTQAELRAAFEGLSDDREVRVAIFTAAGDRAFMAGIDLRARDPDAIDRPATTVTDPGQRFRETLWSIRNCAVPVIAAVNGPALGAGLGFVSMCDLIVAAEGATFGMTEINHGLLGGAAHLAYLVGRRKARELFLTGELITAQELLRLGAVRAVVPRPELMTCAAELARTLAAKSPIALRLAKESMNRVDFADLESAYRTEQDYTARLARFDDAGEARRAREEGRDPDWKWR
jgi:enoyl-CoA hydratase